MNQVYWQDDYGTETNNAATDVVIDDQGDRALVLTAGESELALVWARKYGAGDWLVGLTADGNEVYDSANSDGRPLAEAAQANAGVRHALMTLAEVYVEPA